MRTKATLLCVLLIPLCYTPARAQSEDLQVNDLYTLFDQIFGTILGPDFIKGPGPHGQHFIPAAEHANQQLTPALNSLITSNIASFPLSSTVPGVTFDFSGGRPVRVVESMGPIFSETAATLGQRKLTVGFNATYLGLDQFRGMRLDQMEFTFPHQDVDTSGGLGNVSSETDLIHVSPDLHASATIFAFYATYGVAPNFDVGIAVPFVSANLSGNVLATIDSYTLAGIGLALHSFGGDPRNPVLSRTIAYDESAKGIGDIALRFKFRFAKLPNAGLATLVDVRIPTGDEKNFLGTGSTNVRALLIGSRSLGSFTPHLNVGYHYRGAKLDSDQMEFALGFDQKLGPKVTFAMDALGAIDVNASEAVALGSDAPISITFEQPGEDGYKAVRTFRASNIPNWKHDNTIHLAAGARWAPTDQFQLLGNVLVPMTQGGLNSTVIPTLGFSIVF
ncbi:MAG TPA: hypothetical protein VFG50_12290 [Rhodothermales bacterium]|nr:hypothetical protein [Rhodothermales bacterium]